MKNNKTKRKLIFMLSAACFLVVTVFFYGPLSLYLPNSQELWFSLGDIMKCVLPVSAAVLCVLLILALLLPERASDIVVKLVFGWALGSYLQGNLISIRYGSGVMDGTEIHWEHYTKYALINTAVWVLCLLLPFLIEIILKRLTAKKSSAKDRPKETVRMFVIGVSLFLTAIQLPALVVELVSYRPNEQKLVITEDHLFELSDQKNVLLYVIDTLDEKYYREYTDSHPEFEKEMTGFIHYGNTLASGARTLVAMPSMLTGKPYRREETYSEYLDQVYLQDNPLTRIAEDGTKVDIYSQPLYFSDQMTAYVENFSKERQKVGSWSTLIRKVYKLTMSRFLPHLLKKYVWFDTAEFNEAKDSRTVFPEDDAHFIKAFRNSGFTSRDDAQSVFQLYHLYGAHSPYRLAEDGTRKDKTSVKEQTAGCLNAVAEMMQALKDSGYYDDALIIITADHGDKNVAQQPFLLIKQPGSEGEYTSSDIPVSLFDLPGILYEAYGYDYEQNEFGKSLSDIKEDEVRERHFFHNQTGSSRLQTREYRTMSTADDYDAMELISTFEDAAGTDTPYTLGTKLMFDAEATGNRYCTEGFGTNSGFRTVMTGPHSQLVIPISDLPKKGDLKVSVKLHAKSVKNETSILANGTEVFHDVVGSDYIKSGISFKVPVSAVKDADGILTIDFLYPGIPEEEMEKPTEKRTWTLSIVSLLIE